MQLNGKHCLSAAQGRSTCPSYQRVTARMCRGFYPAGRLVDDTAGARAHPETSLTVGGGEGDVADAERVDDMLLGIRRARSIGGRGKERFPKAGTQSVRPVGNKHTTAGIKAVNPVEIVQPQDSVALPQLTVAVGVSGQLICAVLVARHHIERMPVGDAENALAVDKHLSAGQFNNLTHLTGGQAVGHSPVTLSEDDRKSCRKDTYHEE